MTIQILKGHVSPETAYVIEDYPYGFKLRCKIRYWMEYKNKIGFRFISQTSNPKKGDIWNKPKALTYDRLGGCMYLNEEGHVKYTGLSEYCSGKEAQEWLQVYGDGISSEEGKELLQRFVAAKLAYDAARTKEDPLTTGLKEAYQAFAKKP
jgi:hypothetical protein